MAKDVVAILGGTGDQGLGLAYRFAQAGRPVRIGSRKEERALEAAEQVRSRFGDADLVGLENAEATRAAAGGIVIISVPFEHTVGTIKSIRDALENDRFVEIVPSEDTEMVAEGEIVLVDGHTTLAHDARVKVETDEEPEFMREIVEMYIADANDMLEELKENFAKPAPDYAQARATLHKLKGSSSTFGADGVQAKCEALREHCVKEDLERCREGEGSLAELGTNISDLSAFLARYTAKAKEIHEAKAAAASAAEKTS